MKFCENCGHELNEGAAFCSNCGTKIPVAVQAPVEAVIPEPVQEVVPEPVQEVVPEPVQEVVPEPVQEVIPEPVQEVIPEPVQEPAYVAPQQPVYTQPVYNQPVYSQPVYTQPVQPEKPKSSPTAMILGIIGIVVCWFFALAGHGLSITGIILGAKEAKRTGNKAGLILSIIGEVCSCLSSLIGVIGSVVAMAQYF